MVRENHHGNGLGFRESLPQVSDKNPPDIPSATLQKLSFTKVTVHIAPCWTEVKLNVCEPRHSIRPASDVMMSHGVAMARLLEGVWRALPAG